jgi:hypothetical protein
MKTLNKMHFLHFNLSYLNSILCFTYNHKLIVIYIEYCVISDFDLNLFAMQIVTIKRLIIGKSVFFSLIVLFSFSGSFSLQ